VVAERLRMIMAHDNGDGDVQTRSYRLSAHRTVR
jgi:hypothetical protein